MAETLAYAYAKQSNVTVRVARIFNTYGPRMHANDGRVVSNFVIQVTSKAQMYKQYYFTYIESYCYNLVKKENY